jgi:NADPH:quinone reductase-like Zn-dependent oxidoreductase
VQAVAVGVSRVLIGGQAWVSGGLALWGGLADAAAVIGRQLLGPIPLGLLALNLAVALCAFTALRRLMALQEN